MTRVILADDHPLFLSALELSLEAAGVEVVGTSGTGDEVLSLVEKWQPDAVLLDLAMPGMDGLTCVTRLAEKHPDVRVVVVSATDDPERDPGSTRRQERCASSARACNPPISSTHCAR